MQPNDAPPNTAHGHERIVTIAPMNLPFRTCTPTASRALSTLLFGALVSLAGCTKFDVLNATVGSCGYVRTSDIAYGDHARQELDVYQPRHLQPGAGVVIFFYGGDWQTGSKKDYAFVGEALSSRGFVAVLPDYRLYPEVTFPQFVEDGAAAVRWAYDNAARFGGDPAHIYLMGHSAGAHIAALLTLDGHYLKNVGLDRNVIRATAALSGPYDFVPPPDDRGAFGMSRWDTEPDPAIEPTHFVDGHAPPMLLIRGLKDTVVGPENGERLSAAIRRAGGKVECIDYPDRGHAGIVQSLAWPFRWLAPVLDDTAAFFRRH
ncbi:MAG: alpha/beta hydrolase fold family protein [Phycisphaerales bacterium]|jgi:acetyl esterase/lipase|nr:alpha/beta hydrolase fold family protein [Phycisphaerales bacterium]